MTEEAVQHGGLATSSRADKDYLRYLYVRIRATQMQRLTNDVGYCVLSCFRCDVAVGFAKIRCETNLGLFV